MKTLVLDAFSGISGDMFLGALFDLGLSQTDFETELKKLPVTGYHLTVTPSSRSSIQGTDFDVILDDHQVKDNGITEHGHHHGRSFATIKQLIAQSTLASTVKRRATALFEQVAIAEGHVHHKSLEDVHFHEVGAIDSIVDMVGAAIALELMGIDRVIVNNLADGSGTIKIAHGTVPVPVPAVMQMRIGTAIPIHQRFDVHTELITPTGMAIVKCCATAFDTTSDGVIERTGYGFGKRETGSLNALRATLVNSQLSQQTVNQEQDHVTLLATNLDDITGQQLADTIAGLLDRGAKDAWSEPIVMKKGRPAYKLCCLITPQQQAAIVTYLLTTTPAIGIRYHQVHRAIMDRQVKLVTTSYGPIHVKYLRYHNTTKRTLEHDDLRQLATTHQLTMADLQAKILNELTTMEQKG